VVGPEFKYRKERERERGRLKANIILNGGKLKYFLRVRNCDKDVYHPFFVMGFIRDRNYLPWLASNHDPLDLCLLSS
jgi:hypothetical protein